MGLSAQPPGLFEARSDLPLGRMQVLSKSPGWNGVFGPFQPVQDSRDGVIEAQRAA
jgi:hypothetical protein